MFVEFTRVKTRPSDDDDNTVVPFQEAEIEVESAATPLKLFINPASVTAVFEYATREDVVILRIAGAKSGFAVRGPLADVMAKLNVAA